MARIRSIKPEVRTSLVVGAWPREVRYLWVLLWGYLDDEGRGVDDARLVKADCLPLDEDVTSATVEEWLDLIARSSGSPREDLATDSPASQAPLCRYVVNGRRYLHAIHWREHQRPSHPKPSRIPRCPHHESGPPERSVQPQVSHDSGNPRENVAKVAGRLPANGSPEQGSREQGSREQNKNSASDTAARPDTSAKDPANSAKPEERPDVERVCTHLADRIQANGARRPTINKKWRDAARLMLDRDGLSEDQVHRAIEWCQDHEFWRANVLSLPKLREKYDQLRLQAQATPAPRSRASPQITARPAGSSPHDDWMERP